MWRRFLSEVRVSGRSLDIAVVVILVLVVPAVFDGTQGMAILCMMNFDSAIHVRQLDVRAAVAQLSAEIVADKLMMIHVQSGSRY